MEPLTLGDELAEADAPDELLGDAVCEEEVLALDDGLSEGAAVAEEVDELVDDSEPLADAEGDTRDDWVMEPELVRVVVGDAEEDTDSELLPEEEADGEGAGELVLVDEPEEVNTPEKDADVEAEALTDPLGEPAAEVVLLALPEGDALADDTDDTLPDEVNVLLDDGEPVWLCDGGAVKVLVAVVEADKLDEAVDDTDKVPEVEAVDELLLDELADDTDEALADEDCELLGDDEPVWL